MIKHRHHIVPRYAGGDECKEKISATRKEKFALGEYLDSYKRNPESGRFELNLKGESK